MPQDYPAGYTGNDPYTVTLASGYNDFPIEFETPRWITGFFWKVRYPDGYGYPENQMVFLSKYFIDIGQKNLQTAFYYMPNGDPVNGLVVDIQIHWIPTLQ